ncbi:hypothetical protein IT568_08575, partial [bacterium]|nr:hypothetical protein [bacterium]
MKRIFQVFLLSAIFTTNAFAQFTLTTTYAGGNGQAGNMFNVTALADIIITSFDGNFDVGGPYTARIYYKTGSYVGSETTAANWTLLGDSAPFTATVTNAATAIPLPLSLSLAPGNYAFYVTLVASTALNYTNGTAPLTVYAQDSNLQIYQGIGKAYEFGGTFGNTTTSSRIWNGTIHYDLGGPCDDPPVPGTAVSTASTVCSGASSFTLSLTGSSSGVGQTYQWQSSPDNATWSDISGATNPNYATTQTATTYYRCAVTCGSTEYSASVLVTAGVAVGGTAAASVNPVCNGANFTLSLTGASGVTGQTYQWQSSPDNTTWTDIGGATSATYIAQQTSATYYRCNVSCGTTDASASVYVTMETNPVNCYCTAYGITCDEAINNFTFDTINNSTSCSGGYADYTSGGPTTSLAQSLSYPVSITTTLYYSGDQAAVWVDWNQDGVFDALTEQTTLTDTGVGGVFTGTVLVPGTATLGTTRLRARMVYTGTLSPCGTSSYGEV